MLTRVDFLIMAIFTSLPIEKVSPKRRHLEKLSVSTITIIVNKDKGEQNNEQRNSNTEHTN